MLAIATGPRFGGAGGIATVCCVVVVVVPETVTGMFMVAAPLSLLEELTKIVTVVVLLGQTVTVQSLLLFVTRVPCARTPSVIANTKLVCEVVRILNVMFCPEVIVVRSMDRFVIAGAAETARGNAAINKNARIDTAIILMDFKKIISSFLDIFC